MDKRTRQLLILVAVLLASAAGGYAAVSNIDTGYDNPAPISGGVPFGAPNGLYVIVEGDTNSGTERFTNGSDTVVIQSDAGNLSATAAGPANITVHTANLTGQWTNVTDIDASANSVTIHAEGKQPTTVGGNIEEFSYQADADVAADDGAVDFVYAGSSGTSSVSLSGAPPTTTLGAVDGSNGQLLDVATSTADGTVTFDTLDNSEHAVMLQTGETPVVTNPEPSGDLSPPPNQLALDINDSDFAADTVEIEFSYEGSLVGTQTTSTNGTITQSIANPDGGAYNWSVDISDEYGNTVNDSYSFRVPTNITFRTELPPHSVIDNETVRATCYEDQGTNPVIINRTTSDGRINLSGFPTGSEFSCQIAASGYHNRTVLLDSLYEQENIFLINKSEAETVENRFIVNDRTGQFPPEDTEIVIQVAVNQSLYSTGGYEWVAASGDDLGADQAFVDDLEEEKRYRIIVENEEGDQRNLGSYVPQVSGTIELNIGSITGDTIEPEGVAFNTSYVNESSGRTIRVEYNDTAEQTETLYLNIYERGNQSNILVDNESFDGPFGTFAHTEPVPASQNDTTWVIEVTAVRQNESLSFQQYAGPGYSVLDGMPDWLVTVIFVGVIWGVAGTFSRINGHVGGIVVAGLGAIFFFVGLVPAYLGGGVVALSLLTAGILFVRGARSGGI